MSHSARPPPKSRQQPPAAAYHPGGHSDTQYPGGDAGGVAGGAPHDEGSPRLQQLRGSGYVVQPLSHGWNGSFSQVPHCDGVFGPLWQHTLGWAEPAAHAVGVAETAPGSTSDSRDAFDPMSTSLPPQATAMGNAVAKARSEADGSLGR